MVICLCATKNMYPQLQTAISFLIDSQPSLKTIYAFVEDDFTKQNDKYVTFIGLSNFTPLKENKANNGAAWSFISMARVYFAWLLPNEDRVIYLDLDTMVQGDLSELWNMDLQGKEIAGVVDTHVEDEHNTPYIENPSVYINSGVMLMDLKRLRENYTTEKMDHLLHTWPLRYPDQDCINLTCDIMQIDCKWNSGYATAFSEHPIISHPVHCKPWNPASRWFPKWAIRYLETGAILSKFDS